MTTLEGRYQRQISKLGETPEAIEYMLDAMRYIQEYDKGDAPSDATTSKKAMGGFIEVERKGNKHQVFQRYLVEVEGDYEAAKAHPGGIPDPESWSCARCGVLLLFHERESQLVCPSCGETQAFAGSHCTYDQEANQMTKVVVFAYKRMNHFTDWLNTLQGKENKEIPPELLEAVKAEFKKSRVTTRSQVTPQRVHAYLKKLRMSDYYDNCPSICRDIGGMPPPQLPKHLEDRLKQMFTDIQDAFERAKPPDRKNFLSYGYVLRKFCQLLSEDAYADMFPLLKSTEKLKVQDTIWKKICAEMGWQFIPSI